jgi:RNA polymerase sigma-70 factor (ECF subfamily)
VDMAFMKALKKLDCYNPKYAFSTWLFTIATKMAMQYLKDKKRWSSLDQEVFGDGGGVTAGDRLATEVDIQPEDDLRYKLKAEVIMEHIDQLDERYKRVIVMRELQNMAYQDIADQLDMNLSTVKNHIRSGRQILMKNVEQTFDLIDKNY